MPLYDYQCDECGCMRDEVRPVGARDTPAICPECGGSASRVFSVPNFMPDHSDWSGDPGGARFIPQVWDGPGHPKPKFRHRKELEDHCHRNGFKFERAS